MPKFEEPPGNHNRRVVSLDKARKGKSPAQHSEDMQKELQRAERADTQRAERNMAPERISVATCHVCQHPYRDFIETMLVKGQSYKGISARVSPHVDRRSISNHWQKHMDLQDAALRAILEEEAKVQNQDYEEGLSGAITKRGVLEIALRKGYEDIINGVTTVEARDLIQIAKVLGDMDANQQAVGLDELRSQVQIFIQAIKDVCPPEMQAQIASRVKQLRKRENIDAQIEVEAEVVE
jgi:hypothetical protein